jgi:plastocyanin
VPRPRFGPDSRESERVAAARARATNSTPPAPVARGTMTFDPGTQRPPSAITVGSQTGLRHSCFVYRGAGRVSFTPRQAKTWEDTRAGANSPWAPRWFAPAVPADGKYQVSVTFEDPGEYTIRCLASDGALNTVKDIVVRVK